MLTHHSRPTNTRTSSRVCCLMREFVLRRVCVILKLLQMGNPCMHVLFVPVYAHSLPLDPNSRTSLTCTPKYDLSLLSQGVVICVAGLGLLVGADQLTNKDWQAINKGKGDAFMILGATLYGFSAPCTVMVLARETDRNLCS